MRNTAALKRLRRLLRAFHPGFGLALLAPSIGVAGVEVCQPPSDFSRLAIGYYNYDESAVDGINGEVRRKNHNIDLNYAPGETGSFGIAHRYVILDVDPLELQTNGHLHTVYFPVHRQRDSDGNGFRFSFAPSLSASSNVMKDPGEYSGDTLQLLAALMWRRALSDRADLRYGVCSDHRFGKYRIYPSITIGWRPRPELTIELGFPTTRMTYQARPGVDLSLRIAPDGNEWHVKSKDLETQSQLVYRATLVEWTLNWRAVENLVLTFGVGRVFDNHYDVTLLDDRRVRLSGDAVTRAGAALEWRF